MLFTQSLLLLLLPLLQALAVRYGEPRDMELLTQLAGSVATALGTHWLGINDLSGSGRLDAILKGITKVGSSSVSGDGSGLPAAGGKQKAELGLQQLDILK